MSRKSPEIYRRAISVLHRLCTGLLVNIVALGTSVLVLDITSAAQPTATEETSKPEADSLIVGAGIAGLSAALELARGGASVTVIDTFSVFGGHAPKLSTDFVSRHQGRNIRQ